MTRQKAEALGSVAVVTLGCARNDVDSEELAGRLSAQGWTLVADAGQADVAVVNTCGFIEQAKKDSIDALLEAADLKEHGPTKAVVAVGCLAERYGRELAAELPEADAVLGFDSYADLSAHLQTVLRGGRPPAHVPRDRRQLLPLAPLERQGDAADVPIPGHAPGGSPRVRLGSAPWAPLKIASGCDRRCAFCAIPAFRGSFVSRRPTEILTEARWLASHGVSELLLVSENSTSYGKDLGDLRLLETLLPELAAVEGIERVRVSYLQPAEIRPGLLEVIAGTPGVAPYADLSFQHASAPVLRRMRRFGDAESFLALIDRVRALAPEAGIRSNVIVGFPGETDGDVDVLTEFLTAARLDVAGVFAYSDEDGTEAATYPDHVPAPVVAERLEGVGALAEELMAQRALDRVGQDVDVLIDAHEPDELDEPDEPGGRRRGRGVRVVGRAAHQGPEVDGVCEVRVAPGARLPDVGTIVRGRVVGAAGVDLEVALP